MSKFVATGISVAGQTPPGTTPALSAVRLEIARHGAAARSTAGQLGSGIWGR